MGITLLPVAAGGSSLAEPVLLRTNLPEGILSLVRVEKRLLEVAEDCISLKKELGGGFGLVWFL